MSFISFDTFELILNENKQSGRLLETNLSRILVIHEGFIQGRGRFPWLSHTNRLFMDISKCQSQPLRVQFSYLSSGRNHHSPIHLGPILKRGSGKWRREEEGKKKQKVSSRATSELPPRISILKRLNITNLSRVNVFWLLTRTTATVICFADGLPVLHMGSSRGGAGAISPASALT